MCDSPFNRQFAIYVNYTKFFGYFYAIVKHCQYRKLIIILLS